MKKYIRIISILLFCVLVLTSCKRQNGNQKTTESQKTNSEISVNTSTVSSEESTETSAENSAEVSPTVTSETPTESVKEEAPKAEEKPKAETKTQTETKKPVADAIPNNTTIPVIKPITPKPLIPDMDKTEMRAVWISFLEFDSILKGKTESKFKASIKDLFAKCKASGINTVIVHVRSHGDAYYPSKYFPTSYYFTGKRGAAAKYDPLKIMLTEAHSLGLRIEAWINPYRGARINSNTNWNLTSTETTKKWLGTSKVFATESLYHFNPANAEVQKLILNQISEILDNYQVDGIHFDDYFYPSGCGDCDKEEYEQYKAGLKSGETALSLADFRRKVVSELVKSTYNLVHNKATKTGRKITFGISPAGNLNNCMNGCYADVKLWGSTAGYVDYLAPQIYWSYDQGSLPYLKALDIWANTVTSKDVKLIIGLAAYRVDTNDYWKGGNILARQITDARKKERYAGFIMFRSDFYFGSVCNTERANVEKLLK